MEKLLETDGLARQATDIQELFSKLDSFDQKPLKYKPVARREARGDLPDRRARDLAT